jgi:hypothetical protein
MTFIVVMIILVFVLARRGLLKFAGFARFLSLTGAATLLMGVVSWLVWQLLQPRFAAAGTALRLIMISLEICVSAGVFLALAGLFRLGESRQIITTVLGLVPGRGRRDVQ